MVDLLGAHWVDVPTIDPRYWTAPARDRSSGCATIPTFVRVFGICGKHAGEPGYASRPVDFLPVRDGLDWSLPLAWHLPASKGHTPMISRRLLDFTYITENGPGGTTSKAARHIVTNPPRAALGIGEHAGRLGFDPSQPDCAAAGPPGRPAGLRR